MPHIEIDAAGIGQKPAVTRGLIMAAMVQIEDTTLLHMEQMIADFVGKPGRRMIGPLLIDQEPVFRFESEDAVQHLTLSPEAEDP